MIERVGTVVAVGGVVLLFFVFLLWYGGCVPSLSGFMGSIVDFTFFVYGDSSCLLFVLVE